VKVAEPQPQLLDKEQRYREARHVTLVAAVVNAFLAAIKIVLGFIGQSQALIADGIHSLADLASDIAVIVAAKHGSREADEEHPYGHGRIETVVTVLLGLFLIGVAVGILFDAVSRIVEPSRLLSPTWHALLAAFISILANEFLFQYTLRAAKKNKSNLLRANAWHHRTDSISSVIALIGIAGTMAGLPFLDSVAAIGVSMMIAKVGWDLGWASLQELIDAALEKDKIDEIRKVILGVDGVKAVHSLRTRSHGGMALVDVHILVKNSRISVSEGHQISETVHHRLLRQVDEVTDVTVHIDPEDDENCAPNSHLPLRQTVRNRLEQYWRDYPEHTQIKWVTLHYLNGKLEVELGLPLELATSAEDAQKIQKKFASISERDNDIARISVNFC
jgi:cation diffusion facilitator family transporter